MNITKKTNKNGRKNKCRSTNRNNEIERKFISNYNLSNNNLKKVSIMQTDKNKNNIKEYLTTDEEFNDDLLLSIKNRFNDIFEKIKGTEKIFAEIEKRNKKVSNDVIKGAVFLRKLGFQDNFPKKKKKIKIKIDVNKVIEIQRVFKGHFVREVNSKIDRLKLRQCLFELFCLLIHGHWCRAKVRFYFKLLKEMYDVAKLYAGEEIGFVDKITFKLPKCFYSGTKINDLQSERIGRDLNLK
jgi:hypothetical protein